MNKKVILGILISIALVYLSVRGINFQDVFHDLKNPVHVCYFFTVLVLIMQWLRSYRWGVMLQPMKKIDQFSSFSIYIGGLSGNSGDSGPYWRTGQALFNFPKKFHKNVFCAGNYSCRKGTG